MSAKACGDRFSARILGSMPSPMRSVSEINADYNTTAEQLGSIVSTNQSASSNDVETLIELIATFQSALTSEELVELYPERAEFAAQTLMLLDGN